MSDDEINSYAILADVGGTFARLSRVHLRTLQMDKVEIYTCADFISFEAVFRTYQAQHELQQLKRLAVAIACPVWGDLVRMTNLDWQFSLSDLKHSLALTELKVMNDFAAIAMSIPVLASYQKIQIGAGIPQKDKVTLVLGAGTGLGMAYLIAGKAFASEGGHADWSVQSEQEWFIYNFLKSKYSHVSYERILSGQGLEHLYQAIAAYQNQSVDSLKAAQIINLALEGQCGIAKAVIAQFFSSLGAYAGDLALTFAAFGGVYIAGGIVPRLEAFITSSDFRQRFEEKGRFCEFNATIPTYIIKAEQPGMMGAAMTLTPFTTGSLNHVS